MQLNTLHNLERKLQIKLTVWRKGYEYMGMLQKKCDLYFKTFRFIYKKKLFRTQTHMQSKS